MGSDTWDWVVRAGIGVVLGAIGGLFMRVRTNESRLSVVEKSLERQGKTEAKVETLTEITTRIDERLAHLPRHDDLQRIHDRISRNGEATKQTQIEIAAVKEISSGLRSSVDRLHRAAEKGD